MPTAWWSCLRPPIWGGHAPWPSSSRGSMPSGNYSVTRCSRQPRHSWPRMPAAGLSCFGAIPPRLAGRGDWSGRFSPGGAISPTGDLTFRPCQVKLARGSARSIEGINITNVIAANRNLVKEFGGHPMAAGLSIDPANIPDFRSAVSRTVLGHGNWVPEGKGFTD